MAEYPDIVPVPRTQQEIDDYGPNGIDLMRFKDRPYKLPQPAPYQHPFANRRMDE